MEAKASPLKPYVVMRDRSENVDSLEVVKRSASIGRSVFLKHGKFERDSSPLQVVQTYTDATPVVLYLKQLHASIFHCDSNRR